MLESNWANRPAIPLFNRVSNWLQSKPWQIHHSVAIPPKALTTDQLQLTTKPTQALLTPVKLFDSAMQLSQVQIEAGVSAATQKALRQIPGSHWAGKLASNGNREVAIVVPPSVDRNKPIELVYYFHGHYGQIASSLNDPQKGIAQALQDMNQQGRNAILVIPQGPSKDRAHTWMHPTYKENMAAFQHETMALLQSKLGVTRLPATIVVKGHSAGGLPIMNAANAGTLMANRIDYLDASYGHWASQTYHAFVKTHPGTQFNLVYIPGSPTAQDAFNLRAKAGVVLHKTSLGHGVIPHAFFGK